MSELTLEPDWTWRGKLRGGNLWFCLNAYLPTKVPFIGRGARGASPLLAFVFSLLARTSG